MSYVNRLGVDCPHLGGYNGGVEERFSVSFTTIILFEEGEVGRQGFDV